MYKRQIYTWYNIASRQCQSNRERRRFLNSRGNDSRYQTNDHIYTSNVFHARLWNLRFQADDTARFCTRVRRGRSAWSTQTVPRKSTTALTCATRAHVTKGRRAAWRKCSAFGPPARPFLSAIEPARAQGEKILVLLQRDVHIETSVSRYMQHLKTF